MPEAILVTMKLSLIRKSPLLLLCLGYLPATSACSSEEPVVIDPGRSTGGSKAGGSGGSGSGGWLNGGAGGEGGAIGNSETPVEAHGHLRVEGTQLVDEDGNPVQLKGVSSQWLNWEDDGYALSLDALIWMRDNWKLSLIRAAMGAESDASGSYLDANNSAIGKADMVRQVRIIVDNAVEAGVYVLIDFHSHSAQLHQEEAAEFFQQMTEEYGDVPNVLFETFNEPKDVSETEPLEWPEIKAYHEKIVDVIRANDTDNHENIVILGTPRWSQGVGDAAASPLEGNNLMYTIHFYSCTHGDWLLNQAKSAVAKGLPIFATEWGATAADGGVGATAVCASEADKWLAWMDEKSISWAAWKLDDCDSQTNADTSCILKRNAPLDGGWTEEQLNGHGSYVVEKIKN